MKCSEIPADSLDEAIADAASFAELMRAFAPAVRKAEENYREGYNVIPVGECRNEYSDEVNLWFECLVQAANHAEQTLRHLRKREQTAALTSALATIAALKMMERFGGPFDDRTVSSDSVTCLGEAIYSVAEGVILDKGWLIEDSGPGPGYMENLSGDKIICCYVARPHRCHGKT